MWPFRRSKPKPPDVRESFFCRICGAVVGDADALRVRDRWPICPSCIAHVVALNNGTSEPDSAPTWLAQAASDLSVARTMLQSNVLHMVFFFCHEAIEKAVRGFLVSRKEPHSTHSIFWLARRAARLDQRFEQIGSDAWTLDTLYVFSRYPFGTPAKAPCDFFTDHSDAEAAVTVANDVVALVEHILGPA